MVLLNLQDGCHNLQFQALKVIKTISCRVIPDERTATKKDLELSSYNNEENTRIYIY